MAASRTKKKPPKKPVKALKRAKSSGKKAPAKKAKPPAKRKPVQDHHHPTPSAKKSGEPDQLLHLVFGGELKTPAGLTFKDLSKLDIIGIYPNYAAALAAWRGAAQASVDNAHMRYFVVHIHRMMDPDAD
jgi:hypothetical protein